MDSNLAAILLTVLGGGIGFLARHYIEKRKELLLEVNKERRDLYQKFANLLVDIIKNSKTKKNIHEKALSELYEIYKKYILYASPEVINHFSDYFQFLYHENDETNNTSLKKHFEKLTSIMVAMRKDLGLKNHNLGKNGVYIMRALLTDFDKIIEN